MGRAACELGLDTPAYHFPWRVHVGWLQSLNQITCLNDIANIRDAFGARVIAYEDLGRVVHTYMEWRRLLSLT